MKASRRLAVGVAVAAAAAMVLAGCSKSSSVDTSKLETSFKSSEPATQSDASKAVAAIKSADYAGALTQLQSLAAKAKLTELNMQLPYLTGKNPLQTSANPGQASIDHGLRWLTTQQPLASGATLFWPVQPSDMPLHSYGPYLNANTGWNSVLTQQALNTWSVAATVKGTTAERKFQRTRMDRVGAPWTGDAAVPATKNDSAPEGSHCPFVCGATPAQ